MKLACCDIGNTSIKIGLYYNDKLENLFVFYSLKGAKDFLLYSKPEVSAVSSVVPKSLELLSAFIKDELGSDLFIVDNSRRFRLEINYLTPLTLGTDRICSSEGAFNLFREKSELRENELILTADLGTATTINVIGYPNKFLGGVIAPGPGLLFKALKLYTSQLPEASMDDFTGTIGKSTSACIASGVRSSVSGLLEQVYKNLSGEKVIAAFYITGGNAPEYLDDLSFKFEHKPDLLISGIKAIYEYNSS